MALELRHEWLLLSGHQPPREERYFGQSDYYISPCSYDLLFFVQKHFFTPSCQQVFRTIWFSSTIQNYSPTGKRLQHSPQFGAIISKCLSSKVLQWLRLLLCFARLHMRHLSGFMMKKNGDAMPRHSRTSTIWSLWFLQEWTSLYCPTFSQPHLSPWHGPVLVQTQHLASRNAA